MAKTSQRFWTHKAPSDMRSPVSLLSPRCPFKSKVRLTHSPEQGAIGGTADKIGGPLAKDGVIGKQFTTEGSIGGTVQNVAGGTSSKSN